MASRRGGKVAMQKSMFSKQTINCVTHIKTSFQRKEYRTTEKKQTHALNNSKTAKKRQNHSPLSKVDIDAKKGTKTEMHKRKLKDIDTTKDMCLRKAILTFFNWKPLPLILSN